MTTELAEIGLAAFKKAADVWKSGRADSLIEFTRPTRVEPIVLVDPNVTALAETPDVMQSLLLQFVGYYLQAVALMADVAGVSVLDSLSQLSPDRDYLEHGLTLVAEAYKDRLPMANAPRAALEAEAEALNVSKDAIASLKDLANLSVGKLLNVEIKNGGQVANIPVQVRLIASQVPTETLIHILTNDVEDKSQADRYAGWKSGRLSFIRDLIFCQDLIDRHRKNLIADKDGVHTAISNRARGNFVSTVLTGNPSVATASNMVVMSESTARQLEVAMSGKLSNAKSRERLFDNTTLMIIAVIDPHYSRVTFYHRSIPVATELDIRDLKASNKSGPDVSDILKAYSIGSAPVL